MKLIIALLSSVLLCTCNEFTKDRVYPDKAEPLPFQTGRLQDTIPTNIVDNCTAVGRIVKYSHVYTCHNGSFLGTRAQTVEWIYAPWSCHMRMQVTDGAFQVYYDWGFTWMKPLGIQPTAHSATRFSVGRVTKEGGQIQPYLIEGERRGDTIFVYRGTYAMYIWEPMIVQAVDTLLW